MSPQNSGSWFAAASEVSTNNGKFDVWDDATWEAHKEFDVMALEQVDSVFVTIDSAADAHPLGPVVARGGAEVPCGAF